MQKSHGMLGVNRAPVSSSKEKKDADSGERGAQRHKRSCVSPRHKYRARGRFGRGIPHFCTFSSVPRKLNVSAAANLQEDLRPGCIAS